MSGCGKIDEFIENIFQFKLPNLINEFPVLQF